MTLSALCLLGGVFFSSCQTSDSSSSDPATRYYDLKDTSLIFAETATWKVGKDSGSATLGPFNPTDSTKHVTITMAAPLGKNAVDLSLWALGVRTTVITLIAEGDEGLAKKGEPFRDQLARNLLSLLKRRYKLDSTQFSFTKQGLIDLYARELIENVDTSLSGFPARRPVGIDSAAVVDALLSYQASKKVVFASLGKSFFGVDSASAHTRILALISVKKISSVDSLALFPLPPVRAKTDIKLAKTEMVAGGSKVGVQGIFEADADVGIASIKVSVLDANDSDRTAEWFTINQPSSPGGKATWDLSNQLSISADLSAKAGAYKVVIVAWGKDNKYMATVRLPFQVLPPPPAPDRTGPNLVFVDPIATTLTVENEVTTYTVKVSATDSSVVDSLYIDNAPAVLANDGSWSRVVALPVVGAPTEVNVRSLDKLGNESHAAVYITRKAPNGSVGPKILFQGASDTLRIPFAQKTIKLAWSIKEPIKFATLNGVPVTGIDTLYSAEVVVPATGLPVDFRFLAISEALLGSEHVVRVVRAPDVEPPVAIRDSLSWSATGTFQHDTLVVPTNTTNFTLKWKVYDNHMVRAVTLDGDTLKTSGTDSLYAWNLVNLPSGLTKATLIAMDSVGKSTIVYAKILRRDRVALNFSLDSVFFDVGTVKAVSPTPGAVVEYSMDGKPWTVMTDMGIKLTASATIVFRGRADGFTDNVISKEYTIKVTPPPQAKGAVWNEFNWDDPLRVWQ